MNGASRHVGPVRTKPPLEDTRCRRADGGSTVIRASRILLLLLGLALAVCAAPSLQGDFTRQPDETLPGFKEQQVYDFNGVDSVNLFSGDLHVTVPLGPEYPLSSGLTWRLAAHYSSKLWHMFQYDSGLNGSADCPGVPIPVRRAHVNGYSTLGIGWTLELGYIRPSKGGSATVYKSPDGAHHMLPGGFGADSDLRLDQVGGTYLVRQADGTVLEFAHLYEIPAPVNGFDFSDEDRPGTVETDSVRQTLRYGLSSIVDRFGNTVLQVTYLANCTSAPCPANAWKVGSVQLANPTRTIQFNWGQYVSPSGNFDVITSIGFPSVGAGTLTATFGFKANGALARSGFDSGHPPYPGLDIPTGPTSTHVPFLESITQGDQTYSFEYDAADPNGNKGVMITLTLPTGGKIAYGYSSMTAFYPRRCGFGGSCVPEEEAGGPCPATSEPESPTTIEPCTILGIKQSFMDFSPSVISRTQQDRLGGALNSTTYYERQAYGSAEGAGLPVSPDRVVRRVIVKRPDGNGNTAATKHVFAATLDGVAGVEMSRRYYADCNTGGTPVRSVVQCYPKTPIPDDPTERACSVMGTLVQIARLGEVTSVRPIQQVTWYGANPLRSDRYSCNTGNATPCWQDVYSGFNTFASEYATVTRSSNNEALRYPEAASRTTTTHWDPVGGQSGETWLPKLYSWRTVTDTPCLNLPCTVMTNYEFNPQNGFLDSSYVTDPTFGRLTESRGMHPTNGDPVTESLAGSFDAGTTFTNTGTFQSGLVTSVKRTAPEEISWKSFDVSRDAGTGLITQSRDPNGLTATYQYDSLMRLLSATPPDETATTYCYKGWNTTGEMSTVLAKRGGSRCDESDGVPGSSHGPFDAYQYDGLGRLRRQMRRLPNTLSTGSYFAFRETRYNTAGLVEFESEWTPCSVSPSATSVRSCYQMTAPEGTTYSNFDFLGRARSIKLADDKVITKSFDDPSGIPNSDFTETVSRDVGGVTVNSGSRKDVLGRLVIVGEPAPAPAPFGLRTDYAYNVLDKLVTVAVGIGTGDPAGTPAPAAPQVRTFTYDALGFLRSETHPEKGTTSYTAYNALGAVREKEEAGGTYTYKYEYDALGRLKKSIVNDQLYLDNDYDKTVDGSGNSRGWSLGKLTTSIGWNRYPSTGYDTQFFPGGSVTDSFYYGGVGGRPSKRTTTLSNGSASTSAGWTYNNLGLVGTESYPRIDPVQTPFSVTTSYRSGLPTALSASDGQVVASSVTYHPWGGIKTYSTGNTGYAVTTTIAADPDLMARPGQISASVGSFNTGAYSYDGSGNVKSMGTDAFTYDANSRLLSARYSGMTKTYAYDAFNNLTQKAGTTFSIDPATNRLTGTGYAYDTRGNLTMMGAETYAYDGLGRQARHDAGTPHFSYLFDGANERIVKSIPPPPRTTAPVLRRDMARIIVQALGEKPLATYPNSFDDVSPADPERGWIEKLLNLGITGGCGTRLFCPNNSTSRREMAVFLSVAIARPGAVPTSGIVPGSGGYDCRPSGGTSLFADVPANDWGCPYVHYLFMKGVTAGCGTNPLTYCPDKTTDHWEMEVFSPSIKTADFRYVPPQATYTFRGANGSILTEYLDSAVAKDYVYLGSKLVGTKEGSGWKFHSTDHLGTVRLTTNATGGVLDPRRFWPWGEDVGTASAGRMGFAGMERDLESALPRYYDHARSLETGKGRFLTPDMLSGNVEDPLSWNRYAYARNNPLKYVDPDGRDDELAADFMMREQVRDMGGDAAVARMDPQRAVITATIAGTAAVGLASAEWGTAAMYAGQQALTWLGDKFSPAVQGRYGQVAQSELARAASAEGPAVQVVTRLTSAPEAGRALSISTGEGATALSNAARASGNLYQAQIPKAFLAVLEKNGLAFSQRTMMNGKVGMEYRILPQATEYIVKLFRQVPGDGAGGTK